MFDLGQIGHRQRIVGDGRFIERVNDDVVERFREVRGRTAARVIIDGKPRFIDPAELAEIAA